MFISVSSQGDTVPAEGYRLYYIYHNPNRIENTAIVIEYISDNMAQFSWDHCDKTFNQRAGLSRHVRLNHANGKSYKCSTCDKGFTRKDYLNRHMKIHEGPQYYCKICGKSFYRKDKYQQHERTHHQVGGLNKENEIGQGDQECQEFFEEASVKALHKIVHYLKDKIGVVYFQCCVIFDTL